MLCIPFIMIWHLVIVPIWHTVDAMAIEEEKVAMPRIPTVPPNSVFHYNPPGDFHAKQTNIHKFHFAVANPAGALTVPSPQSLEDGSKVKGHEWSEAVDIMDSCNATRSEIVAMPTGGYLLISTECVGTLIHVFLESLNSKEEKEEVALPEPPQISQSIGTAGITVMVGSPYSPLLYAMSQSLMQTHLYSGVSFKEYWHTRGQI